VGALARLMRDPEGRVDRWLLFVFLIINGLVLINAVLHEPTVQYDGEAHFAYISTLAEWRLPTPTESYEFFSPPLPYFLPALANATGLSTWWAAKFGQMVNVALSLGITGAMIALCRSAKPTDENVALFALMCLGAIPVYYKTMAFVRGEPYAAFLTLLGIAVTARAVTSGRPSLANVVLPGVCWGLLALARQWGALSAAGLLTAVWLTALRDRDRNKLAIGLAGPLVALAVGGWFYAWLWVSQSSPIAFDQPPANQWSLRNQPADFYLGTGNGRLFTDPIMPSFPNQAIPIFYAETWGDYWGYFSIYGRDPMSGGYVTGPEFQAEVTKRPLAIETNRYTLNDYLGRVNLLGLLPTALALAAFGAAAIRLPAALRRSAPLTPPQVIPLMAILIIIVSAIGYLWFLIRFPYPLEGDTIKASYMLQVFAPFALLTADFMRRIPIPLVAWLVAWGLLMIHNIPAITTHFIRLGSLNICSGACPAAVWACLVW
jgi:hypothetical protein